MNLTPRWAWFVPHQLLDQVQLSTSVLTTAIEKLGLTESQQLDFLFTAGAFGLAIANNASISGAEGGCQAGVGSAFCYTVLLLQWFFGTPFQASQAIWVLCLRICWDSFATPAGLVEVHVSNVMLREQVFAPSSR